MAEIPLVTPAAVSLQQIPRINPHYRFQWEEAQNTWVLLYPEGMVRLNPSAAEILSLCDGEQAIQTVVRQLAEKFPEVEYQDIEQDILGFFADAYQRQWLQDA